MSRHEPIRLTSEQQTELDLAIGPVIEAFAHKHNLQYFHYYWDDEQVLTIKFTTRKPKPTKET